MCLREEKNFQDSGNLFISLPDFPFRMCNVYEMERVKQKRKDETFAHETNVF